MTVTYRELYQSRQKWNPRAINHTPLDNSTQEGVEAIQKVLALAIHLELPVGVWVADATKRELPISEDALKLLKSNIADETVHQRAFEFAIESYPVSEKIMDESQVIANAWIDLETEHPLFRPALLECGVFLLSLTVLNLIGGQSLFNLSFEVGRDEQRHIATNRSILRELGYNPSKPPSTMNDLKRQTIDWMIGDLVLNDLGVDKDFFIIASDDLVETGFSRDISELTGGAVYRPPFESRNKVLDYDY